MKEIVFGNLPVTKGVTSSVNAILAKDASFFIKKTKSSSVVQNVTFKDNLEAPIEKGDVIGKVEYTLEGEVIQSIDIIAENGVKKMTLINVMGNLYWNWFNMMR